MTLANYPDPKPWKVAADFHVPEGFSDTSYHNDLNPSVTCDATGHQMLWDTETKENLKAEGLDDDTAKRFAVYDPETGDALHLGDDLAEAIRIARGE